MKTRLIQRDLKSIARFNVRTLAAPAICSGLVLMSGCSQFSSNTDESADVSAAEVNSPLKTTTSKKSGSQAGLTTTSAQSSAAMPSKTALGATNTSGAPATPAASPATTSAVTASIVTGLPKFPTTPPKLSPALKKALAKPHYPAIANEQTAQLKQAQTQTAQWAKRVLETSAKPVASGPGLVVCEAIAPSGDTSLRNLGAGAARWLHLVVAGRGEMGKTPLWHAVSDAGREMGKADLRFAMASINPRHSCLKLSQL